MFRCCCPYSCGVRPANPGSRRLWLARLGCLFLLKSEMHVSRSPQEPFPRQCEVLTRRPSSFACVKLRKMQVAVLLVLPPTTLLCEQSPHRLGLALSGPFPFASSRPVGLTFLSTPPPARVAIKYFAATFLPECSVALQWRRACLVHLSGSISETP